MTSGRSLKDYRHKVRLQDLSIPPAGENPAFGEWFDSLPSILAGDDIRQLVDRWVAARRAGRTVIWGIGAHVVKAGLSRWLIDLMEAGLITHLAVNGAVVIHDFELAAVGHTSEDVARGLDEGTFGRAEETALFVNQAARDGLSEGIGLGEALCRNLIGAPLPHRDAGLLAAAARLAVPVTVHLALGTDTVHVHPSADGKALGETSLTDFRRLCDTVRTLEGGVYVNAGSAVLLPEIFLKAVSAARAGGAALSAMTTVVLDFIRQYRPLENVVRRPLGTDGRGFYLIGHHELLIPLLGQAVLFKWRAGR